MSDGVSRLAEMEALSARIDAAQDAGNHREAQDLTAQMMALINTSLGRETRPAEPLPDAFAVLRHAIMAGDVPAVTANAQGLDLLQPHGRHGHFPLIWAMASPKRGPQLIAALIAAGARADQRTPAHDTPLHFLAESSLEDPSLVTLVTLVDLLLQSGGDLDARQVWGWTPLHRCVLEGTSRQLEALLHHGADPNVLMSLGDLKETGLGLTPLMVAGPEPEKVRLLLSHGADPTRRSSEGESAITYLRREAEDAEAQLAANPCAGRFDHALVRGLIDSVELVAGPQSKRH